MVTLALKSKSKLSKKAIKKLEVLDSVRLEKIKKLRNMQPCVK